MSQSPSPSKQMLDSLNEINPVALYTSSCAPSPIKMSTIPLINITEANRPTPQSPIDLNNPTPSFQPGPQLSVLSDCFFEGDHLESRYSESNILTAKDLLGDTKPVFDRIPDVGLPPSSDLEDDEEDTTPL
ncbi:hypothetical protein KY285_020541 [Solanum tuberosum]|nr:hypothetical protein KY285_020541 [Solanum tuberosum]